MINQLYSSGGNKCRAKLFCPKFVKRFFKGGGGLRPPREIFTQTETSPLAVRVLQHGTGHPCIIVISEDLCTCTCSERLAVELPQPVLTTYVCRDRGFEPRFPACETNALSLICQAKRAITLNHDYRSEVKVI